MLALANQERMQIHQMNVWIAFLNGDLTEEILLVQPEAIERAEGLVCRLKRSPHGLEQASKAWNNRFITKVGFKRTNAEQCLYVRGTGRTTVILILYVDDVLVIGHELKEILAEKRSLSKEFEMTDSGEVTSFLGMKIERDVEGGVLWISQQTYLLDLLARFDMSDGKSSSAPMENRLRLENGEES